MYIENLSLKNYRNYENETFEFSKGINILTGNNAQGKTNCAEAIFYLCTGYSPRISKDKLAIRYMCDSAFISANAISKYGKISVSVAFHEKGSKEIKVNGVDCKKIGELIGNINSVFFNPNELKLIKESPEDRRRFMDISLSQMNRQYFYALQKYNGILSQRNNLLKSEDKELIYETLPFWDIKLCEYASIVIYERNAFIEKLMPICSEIHSFLTDGEVISVSSDSAFSGSLEEIQSQMIEALKERYEKDIILGYTTVGPHRDDIKIKVNDKDVKTYGSQGQQRTCALSLKLAELQLFKERFNEYPVLILDDAFSELDSKRRERLLEVVKDIQTIITCTELTTEMLTQKDIKVFKIENGAIVR